MKRKMSGFGHRVYKNYDPRAKVSTFMFEIWPSSLHLFVLSSFSELHNSIHQKLGQVVGQCRQYLQIFITM
jgi:citrate synthase